MTCSVRDSILLLICGFALTVVQCASTEAQDITNSSAAKVVADAATKGFPLTTSSTDVTGNVSVEAVLIPSRIGKTVFGKEISNNYAIISLTISNRSSDESFIVHSVFVDYSEWLLSGGSPVSPENSPSCLPSTQYANTSSVSGAQDTPSGEQQSRQEQTKLHMKPYRNCLRTWQQQTLGNQIDSVENRIVRGELLDRQPWTTRNWVLRALQAAGSIASGFTFATSSQSWIRGIGAFNGVGIPAAQTLWPDATVLQMNRISDFGFQVNKVIAKQSSDIVVAFFPIDRFLTPDLASIFISSPAAFFAPFAAIKDPKLNDRLTRYKIWSKEDEGNLMVHLYPVVSGQCMTLDANTIGNATTGTLAKACQTAELVNRLSLNVVRIRVGGTMTIDVNKVPPQITEVDIDAPADKDAFLWKKGKTLTGVIRGSFLGGGTPIVTNLDSTVLQIKGVAEGSTDNELHFTITWNDDLPTGTKKLSFQVSKKSDGSTITSSSYDYAIPTTLQAGANAGAEAAGRHDADGQIPQKKPHAPSPIPAPNPHPAPPPNPK